MERKARRFLEFDRFRVDVEGRTLLCDGAPLAVTPKVFDLLLLLIENCGHTLRKDELMDKVWAGTYVYEGNLNRHISTLRKVLGDDVQQPRYIRTVPKRGYRFDGEVREILQEEESVVVEKRTNYRLAIKESVATERPTRPRIIWLVPVVIAAGLVVGLFGFPVNLFFGRSDNVAAENPKAYELYLSGRQLWQTRNVEDLHHATRKLEQAVEEAPEFALAHSALADAYAFDYANWSKAEHHANEAIRLDPTIGEPYAAIGFVRTFWEWKPAEAEEYFKRALLLSPDYATGHQWYASNLAIRARVGQALAELRAASELDPASPAIKADLCQVLYFYQKYDAAADQCNATLAIAPDHNAAHQQLYEIYLAQQRYDEAVRQYFLLLEKEMVPAISAAEAGELRTAYSSAGIRSYFSTRAARLEKLQRSSYQIARYHARLGNRDETYRWLRRAGEQRDFDMIFIAADPVFASIAGEPEFDSLVLEFLGISV